MKLNAAVITNNYVKDYTGEWVAMLIRNRRSIVWERNKEGELFKRIMIHIIVEKYHVLNIYLPAHRDKKKLFLKIWINT